MKLKMKRQGFMKLARFVVGALAVAGASMAGGATVQITYDNNTVTSVDVFANFITDLTGDGNDENITGEISGDGLAIKSGTEVLAAAGPINGVNVFASIGARTIEAPTIAARIDAVPFTFTDARLNGGAVTTGVLDIRADAFWNTTYNNSNYSIQVYRLIFDDAGGVPGPPYGSETRYDYPEWVPIAAVPEPSGFLATSLLLGAAGLIRRRQARAA